MLIIYSPRQNKNGKAEFSATFFSVSWLDKELGKKLKNVQPCYWIFKFFARSQCYPQPLQRTLVLFMAYDVMVSNASPS